MKIDRGRHSDTMWFLGFLLAIVLQFAFGLGLFLFGLWYAANGHPQGRREDLSIAVIPGVIFMVAAIAGLVERLRNGPPEPGGRHRR